MAARHLYDGSIQGLGAATPLQLPSYLIYQDFSSDEAKKLLRQW